MHISMRTKLIAEGALDAAPPALHTPPRREVRVHARTFAVECEDLFTLQAKSEFMQCGSRGAVS